MKNRFIIVLIAILLINCKSIINKEHYENKKISSREKKDR